MSCCSTSTRSERMYTCLRRYSRNGRLRVAAAPYRGKNRIVGGAHAPGLRPVDGDYVFDHRYRIVVAGVIGDAGRQAFDGFKIDEIGGNTTLRADLDQSALFGALSRVL